jgi:hypothetical protein
MQDIPHDNSLFAKIRGHLVMLDLLTDRWMLALSSLRTQFSPYEVLGTGIEDLQERAEHLETEA